MRCASRISPGPITTDSLPSDIICAASVPKATVPLSIPVASSSSEINGESEAVSKPEISAPRQDFALEIGIVALFVCYCCIH